MIGIDSEILHSQKSENFFHNDEMARKMDN